MFNLNFCFELSFRFQHLHCDLFQVFLSLLEFATSSDQIFSQEQVEAWEQLFSMVQDNSPAALFTGNYSNYPQSLLSDQVHFSVFRSTQTYPLQINLLILTILYLNSYHFDLSHFRVDFHIYFYYFELKQEGFLKY